MKEEDDRDIHPELGPTADSARISFFAHALSHSPLIIHHSPLTTHHSPPHHSTTPFTLTLSLSHPITCYSLVAHPCPCIAPFCHAATAGCSLGSQANRVIDLRSQNNSPPHGPPQIHGTRCCICHGQRALCIYEVVHQSGKKGSRAKVANLFLLRRINYPPLSLSPPLCVACLCVRAHDVN